MSLKITNRMTPKQKAILLKLEYIGKWDLTVEAAGKVIDELIAERDLDYGEIKEMADGYYDFPDNDNGF